MVSVDEDPLGPRNSGNRFNYQGKKRGIARLFERHGVGRVIVEPKCIISRLYMAANNGRTLQATVFGRIVQRVTADMILIEHAEM